MEEEKEAVAIPVVEEKKPDKKDKDGKEEDEMSPEDKALLEGLNLAVARASEEDPGVVRMALEHLRKEIRASTTSMTSVPKPLKFLRPHYPTLKACYASKEEKPGRTPDEEAIRKELADILSVLAMTMGKEGERESLSYKLKGNLPDLGTWGHEYVRSLAGEIGQEYADRAKEFGPDVDLNAANADLYQLVKDIVPFHLKHNAEAEAVDLLVEVQLLPFLLSTDIDAGNYERICLYLLRCADFMSDPDDLQKLLATAFSIYKAQNALPDALRVALRIGDMERITQVMNDCEDPVVKKQLGLYLARHRVNFTDDDDDDLNEIIGNCKLSEYFLHLARDLDVMEAKLPEDIYKSHLGDSASFTRRREQSTQVDSARSNLADTFVSSFVNAGYGKDGLMTPADSKWLYRNKEHGMMSAAASLGMVYLWNVEEGLVQLDKYLYTQDEYIKAGAVLGIGVVTSGVCNESDPAMALLPEHLEGDSALVRTAACAAFGIGFAGSCREELLEYLLPVVANTDDANMDEVGLAALSLGHVYVGSCNDEVAGTLIQRLMETSDTEFEHPMARFLCLALGLLFFGQMERADAMVEALRTIEHSMAQYASVTLEACAYAGSGNVLKVQSFLHVCAEHLQEKNEHQSAAVLGIALVAMGEDVGSEMALRTFDHLLHYCELPIRRAIPLALALLHVSNPDYGVVDQMSRLTHDNDVEVSHAAILGLGIMGAGTNNSRVAGLLRQLAEHSRSPTQTFVTRLAQGLLHMGKGLVGINPFHSDRLLVSGVSAAGLLTILHACLDLNKTILDKYHYILFYLTGAMNPRMLVTVDEDLEPLQVSVRVGQAVETVGQAGRPKSISGFQTHTTPVLLAVTERAELADQEYLPIGNQLEGVAILKKNEDFQPDPSS